MQTTYDVIFIGAGPGGYTGAIRAAQLGLKTAVIEKGSTLGGTCLNVGCIPSKALLDSSENFSLTHHEWAKHGVLVDNIRLDLPAMMGRKDRIVKELTGGVEFLFKKNKIDWIKGEARFAAPAELAVKTPDGGEQMVKAKNIVIATGSEPIELPGLAFNGSTIVSSTEALKLPQVPKHLLVVGGGYIGLEMGSVWLRLGAQVTVVEFAAKICGTMDSAISKQLERLLAKQGMEFRLETKVVSAQINKNNLEVSLESVRDQSRSKLLADVVLVAAGRRPFTKGLALEAIGLATDERGRIKVDDHWRTSVNGVWAIGDVIQGPMLAHKAEEEGVAVAETIAGGAGHVNYFTVPGVIYTWPEVASVGWSEEEIKSRGIDYKVGTFPFSANGRAKAMGFTDGQVKILADSQTDRVLGVHILGPRASDMIAEAVVALEFGASSEDIARSFHAHPTLSEIMREAALAVDKRARQI